MSQLGVRYTVCADNSKFSIAMVFSMIPDGNLLGAQRDSSVLGARRSHVFEYVSLRTVFFRHKIPTVVCKSQN